MIGTVEFELNGKTQSARLSVQAQMRYQRKYDETFFHGLASVEKDPTDIVRLCGLTWCILSHIEDMTEDAAADVINDIGIDGALILLGKAFNAAYPDAAVEAKNAAKSAEGNAPRAKKSPK